MGKTPKILLVVSGLMAPTAAFAHAWLESSVPAQDGALAAAAKDIALTFDEDIKPVSCKITDVGGKDMAATGKPVAKGVHLTVPLTAALAAGKYSLTCRVVGPDSHPVNNSLSFVVN
jgi:methionine-rich copper-binding protein CopC